MRRYSTKESSQVSINIKERLAAALNVKKPDRVSRFWPFFSEEYGIYQDAA